MAIPTKYSIEALSRETGKPVVYINGIQRSLGLPVRNEFYSEGYLSFLKKVVAFRTAGVSVELLAGLFELEKKILKLLHIESLSDSETWYMDANCAPSDHTLLLTGFDVDFTIGGSIQHGLDFGEAEQEMFTGSEMGEDIRKIMGRYVDVRNGILKRAKAELPGLKGSLAMLGRLIRSTRPEKGSKV